MAKHKLTSLLGDRLGNHRNRGDLLGQATFPGLTIDNLPSTPIGSGSMTIGSQIADLAPQLSALNAQQQSEAQLDADAAAQHTSNSSSGSSSLGSTLGGLASGLLGGGLGVSSLVQGLFSLFGGGGQTVQPLTPFTLPSSISYAAGINGPGGTPVPVDYGAGGQVRSLAQTSASSSGSGSTQAGQTVQVNVSAMDSQSFLDRSDDIANAVRAAMLNSHPLNDVIASL
jgi:hypothetical protein